MTAMVEAETLLSKQHVCCVCVNVAAVALCLQCGDMYCQQCSNVHKKMSMTKHHDVEQLTSLATEKLATYGPITCHDHKDKLCELHCATHDTSLCMLCANTAHRQCPELISQQSLVDKLTGELLQLDEQLAKAVTKADDYLILLDQHVDDVKKDSQAALNDLKIVCDRLKAAIDSRFLKLQNTAKEILSTCIKKATEFTKSVMEQRSMLVTQKRLINLYKTFSEHKYFKDMVTLIKERVQKNRMMDNIFRLHERVSIAIDQQVVADIEMRLSQIGYITLSSSNRLSKGQAQVKAMVTQSHTAQATTFVQAQAPATKTSVVQGKALVKTNVERSHTASTSLVQGKTSVKFSVARDPTPVRTTVVLDKGHLSEFDPMTATLSAGVAFCSEDLRSVMITHCIVSDHSSDELYMAGYDSLSISVYSIKSDRLIANYRLEKNPLSIALVQNRVLAVTSAENVIIFLNFSTLSKPRLQSWVVTKKTYRGITGYAKRNTLLVSCNKYSGTACVDEITLAGEWLRTFVSSDTLSDLNMPDSLHVDTRNDVLYIADCVSDCVFRVQLSTGTVLSKLTHPNMLGPMQVCADSAGNLYVACKDGECVLVKSVRDKWRVLLKATYGAYSVSVKDNSLFMCSYNQGFTTVERYDFINP